MKVQVENLAREQLLDIYYYNLNYSLKNAIETNYNIRSLIHDLEDSPYIGRYIPEMTDKRFRELIYKKTKQSSYRIMYYISEKSKMIFVFSIMNCKQDFIRILKKNNYFNNYINI